MITDALYSKFKQTLFPDSQTCMDFQKVQLCLKCITIWPLVLQNCFSKFVPYVRTCEVKVTSGLCWISGLCSLLTSRPLVHTMLWSIPGQIRHFVSPLSGFCCFVWNCTLNLFIHLFECIWMFWVFHDMIQARTYVPKCPCKNKCMKTIIKVVK